MSAAPDESARIARRRRTAILTEETAYGRASGLAMDLADHLVFNADRPPAAKVLEYERAIDLWLELSEQRRAADLAWSEHLAGGGE